MRLYRDGVIYVLHEHCGLWPALVVVHTAAVDMGQEGGDGLECSIWEGQIATLTIQVL